MLPLPNSNIFNIDNQDILHSDWEKTESESTAQLGEKMQQIRVLVKDDGNIAVQKVEKTIRKLPETQEKGSQEKGSPLVSKEEITIVSTEESHFPADIHPSKEQEKQLIQNILTSNSVRDIPKAVNNLVSQLIKSETPKSEVLKSETSEFPSILQYVKTHLTNNPVTNRAMLAMGESLDKHVKDKFSKQVEHDIKHLQKKSDTPITASAKEELRQKLQKKFTDSLTFFTTVDTRKSPENPLERMASTFAYLSPSTVPSFLEGTAEFASHLTILAFEQHRENPEQYVSHGFDHSINVANYTRDVLAMNPQIVRSMAQKYHVSEGEARFLLENVAFLHDTGYPCVGCRTKAVHGISGADLLLPMRPMFDKVITSPEVNKEVLFNDFRNAIMFHSADKVESQFGVKIHTTMGTFLADPKNIVTVLSNFYDPSKNPSNTPRYALEIFVQNTQEKEAIEKALMLSQAKFQEIYGDIITLPEVKIHEGLFQGRYADLEFNKDKLIGLEFSVTDLLKNPLNMIRLVDNMDMRKTRLTPTQNEPAFREVYARLGDYQGISKMAVDLEDFERNIDKKRHGLAKGDEAKEKALEQELKAGIEAIFTKHLSQAGAGDSLEQQVKTKLKEYPVATINSVKKARDLVNKVLLEVIFTEPQWKAMPKAIQEDVRFIGMQQSSYDFRHFGGTEAVLAVQLKSIPRLEEEPGQEGIPCIVVTVQREHFENLNKVRVKEEGIMVGVGEYQIWRASDAYKSLSLGNTKVQLQVVDEKGVNVPCIVHTS